MRQLTFQINYNTTWGEQIIVVGDIPELGNNDIHQGLILNYTEGANWIGSIQTNATSFTYHYYLVNEQREILREEWGNARAFELTKTDDKTLKIRDSWSAKYHPENLLYNSAFLKVIFQPKSYKSPTLKKNINQPKLLFRIKAPRIEQHQRLCVLGNLPSLGSWGLSQPLLLGNEAYPFWEGMVSYVAGMNVEYKYGIYDTKAKAVVFLEDGANRTIHYNETKGQTLTIANDNYMAHPKGDWKGTGVALPVFGLRTKEGFGIGEFTDIPLLVDWAKKVGMQMVQILPINDTSATGTWVDSYPYAAISVFALHPMYLNIEALKGFDKVIDKKEYNQLKSQLNSLSTVDYEKVNRYKLQFARQIFEVRKKTFLKTKAFKAFFEQNQNWLQPYALFCVLRDKFNTVDFNEWGEYSRLSKQLLTKATATDAENYDDIAFYYYLQFHLDKQLKTVADYARKNGILLKGDIPIGIYRYSVDAWTQPYLYHMDGQAGAPPDPFSDLGQNWGFPTYNWERMAQDGYAWWQNRLKTLSKYFDAFRIDHILGFFRIWQVPYDQIHANLGYFYPALPVRLSEFHQQGIEFSYDRFCKPYITYSYINELFETDSNHILNKYFTPKENDQLKFKPEFDTQRKIENYFQDANNQADIHFKAKLMELHANVLFIEEANSNGLAFHPRFDMFKTQSYQQFPQYIQEKLYGLYLDYYYNRQEEFWANAAMTKLPPIKSATDMLICGEDLGMIPNCVPQVMQDLDVLTLEIQRMSKNPSTEFLQTEDTPYASVCSPSTHDMSPIRLWWESENSGYIQRFYNQELGRIGAAPAKCTPDIAQQILEQHLDLPSMWAVFPLADLLGMDAELAHTAPAAERINEPSNPKHYWRYRIHLTLEELLDSSSFGDKLKGLLEKSGRS